MAVSGICIGLGIYICYSCFAHSRLLTSLPDIIQPCNSWSLSSSSNTRSELGLDVILEWEVPSRSGEWVGQHSPGPAEDGRADCGSMALVMLVCCVLVYWSLLLGHACLALFMLICVHLCFERSVHKFHSPSCIKYIVSRCIIF